MSQEIPRRVLLVEDDEVSARAARTVLERLGCCVDVAPTGAQALEHFEQNPYSLVLMNGLLPDMNGFEATARIRQMPRGHSTPVVGTSARRTRQECLNAGMNDLFPKPFERTKIEIALEKWAPRASSDAGRTWSELIRRVQLGEANAMEELYCDLSRWARPYVLRELGPDGVDEHVEDAYLAVIGKIHEGGLREAKELLPFVLNVVEALAEQRVAKARTAAQPTRDVQERLNDLPAQDREILIRSQIFEQSWERICEEMGLTEAQYQLYKSRARARLDKTH